MTYRNHKNLSAIPPFAYARGLKVTLRKSALLTLLGMTAIMPVSLAAELPEAPSSSMGAYEATPVAVSAAAPVSEPRMEKAHTFDRKFVSLALISSGSTFADSYTTLFARENWLAHKQGVCNMEVQSAYLYGTHPTVGRAYAVASAKSAGSVLAAYYLRRHHSHFWSLPLAANSIISLEGVTQNMIECN